MKTVSVWSRSRLFLPGAGADPIWSEPKSAPGPLTSGVGDAQKSGGSATLFLTPLEFTVCEASYRYIGTGNLISTGNIKTVILKYHTGNTIYR